MREHVAVLAADTQHDLAEGPRWDDVRQSVSWVDIANGHVFQGDLDVDGIRVTGRIDFPDTTGAAAPTTDGGFLVAAHDRLVAVSPDGTRRATAPVLDRSEHLRLNDAAVDPAGRLLVGSLATDGRTGAASLLRLEPDATTTVLREGMNLANGIGWSPDGSTLYVVDSVPGVLWRASYDVDSGEAHGWTPLVSKFDGLPDGLCVDTEGRIWIAVWNGSQVGCYAPTGEALAVVHVPVPHVTAVAFIGPDRDRLLITSARDELDDDARARFPDSGRLFLAHVDAVGLPTSLWTDSSDGPGWAREPDSANSRAKTTDTHPDEHRTPEIS